MSGKLISILARNKIMRECLDLKSNKMITVCGDNCCKKCTSPLWYHSTRNNLGIYYVDKVFCINGCNQDLVAS